MDVTVWRTLNWALYDAVRWAADDDVWRSVNVDVDVNLGVGRVVLEVVRGATGSHLEHHALQDFLREVLT